MATLRFKLFKLEVRNLKNSIAEQQNKLNALLLSKCTHEETREVVRYFSNNNSLSTKIYDECLVCEKRFNPRIEAHPYDKD